jgi:hypothetical protein
LEVTPTAAAAGEEAHEEGREAQLEDAPEREVHGVGGRVEHLDEAISGNADTFADTFPELRCHSSSFSLTSLARWSPVRPGIADCTENFRDLVPRSAGR